METVDYQLVDVKHEPIDDIPITETDYVFDSAQNVGVVKETCDDTESQKVKEESYDIEIFDEQLDEVRQELTNHKESPYRCKNSNKRKIVDSDGLELSDNGEFLTLPGSSEAGTSVITGSVRKRCHICPRKANRCTKICCVKCQKNVCGHHSLVFCTTCVNT